MYRIVRATIQVYNILPKSYKIILSLFLFFTFFFIFYFIVLFKEVNKSRHFQNLFLLKSNFYKINFFDEKKKIDFHNYLNTKNFFDQSLLEEKKNINKIRYNILSGDNLSNILFKNGLNIQDILIIINEYPLLNNLKIGQKLYFETNQYGQLKMLKWIISRNKKLVFIREKIDHFSCKLEKEKQKIIWLDKLIQGTVKVNFIKSAINSGLKINEISEIHRALKWKINLKKLRFGDKFVILLSRKKFSEKSKLLGVHLLVNKKNYYAFRAKNGYYYDDNANCLEKFLLRYPTLKNFRVSSHFNFHRINPITGKKTPHRGVDFSMPNGTPILSVADGKIIKAKYNDWAGNFIVIRHNNKKYTTRYMHLHKILVKKGQNVKRGELIAFSGNTGKVTGPHLHYELWFNKKALNPLTTNLYYYEKLKGKDKKKYLLFLKSDKLKNILNN